MIIVRKTIGKGIAPEILKKQFPYEMVLGGEIKYFTEEGIKELQNKLNEFFIPDVGSSLLKVCKGCGSLSTKVIDNKFLACCPDSNYIPMEDYCKNSIYNEKQF